MTEAVQTEAENKVDEVQEDQTIDTETAEKQGFVKRLVSDLRVAGKEGKKQWEDAFAKTRDFLNKRREPKPEDETTEQTEKEKKG